MSIALPARTQQLWTRRAKPLIFLLCLVPAAWLAWDVWQGNLSANPIEDITRRTGVWGLRMLLLTLAVTPLRQITGWQALVRIRRMLGLFAFFYATLHMLSYVGLDQFFAWQEIVTDIIKRNYILVGMSAWVLLVPLALTSTNGWVRRLGGRRWQKLHRLVYAIGVLGVIHFLWLVKSDITEPALYGLVLAVLLGYRLRQRLAAGAPATWFRSTTEGRGTGA